jgi:hypothetical protein
MRSIFSLLSIFVLLSISVFAADPSYYAKSETWQETVYNSQLAMTTFLQQQEEISKTLGLGPWYLAGPFRGESLRPANGELNLSGQTNNLFNQAFGPENEFGLDNTYENGTIQWQKKADLEDGIIHYFETMGGPIVHYLQRTIEANDQIKLSLFLGSDEGIQVWLNGQKVHGNDVYRRCGKDQDIVDLKFEKGKNLLLVKINNLLSRTGFYFSLVPSTPAYRASLIEDIWARVKKDFDDEFLKQQVYRERRDQVWEDGWQEAKIHELARRYIQAIKNLEQFNAEAKIIAKNMENFSELILISKLYHIDNYYNSLFYIKDNYLQTDSKWRNYKNDFENKVSEINQVFEQLRKNNVIGYKITAELENKLNDLQNFAQFMPIHFPTGPHGPGKFGVYQTKLKYFPEWDEPWRVGDHTDVFVRFDDGGHKFMFWRGTNYIPHWVTENGIWYNNEFNETWETLGSGEPMSDKQCRFSHVRIIENTPARVVLHWRYALNDVNYRIAWADKITGWGDWSDEYYIIYPDAVGVRYIICRTSHFADDARDTDDFGHEWHEGIVLYNAFEKPEESVNTDAIHVANMKGEVGIWSWEENGNPTTPTPEGSNIVLMNVKSEMKPFVVSPLGCTIGAYRGAQGDSRFRWRDHWPTTTEPTPGRNASGDKAAHGSFFHLKRIPVYDRGKDWISKVMLHGMTSKDVNELVPLVKSWLDAPVVKSGNSTNIVSDGYDLKERAYVFSSKLPDECPELNFEIMASDEAPLVNPAFILKNWGLKDITIRSNGRVMENGPNLRIGHHTTLTGTNLIIWLRTQAEEPIKISIKPVSD